MKGTRRRSCCGEEDQRLRTELAASAKDQAENVMIVDLLRNDMGQISRTGSVCVEKLFEIEQYETVWQMTSTVASQTDASIVEIFSALFPCGSVTGAPKVKTTEIIKELESFPRGVYCGAIGWIGPGRQAQFSVAIRTATVDRQRQTAVYNVGAGITYDSVPQDEYDECMAKAAVLRRSCPAFELLESIRHDETGYYLLDGHLTRLSRSAAHFGRKICVAEVAESLRAYAAELGSGPEKVRLLLAHDGTYRIESSPLSTPDRFRLGFAATPTCTDSPFISHKTTRREHYDQARATRPDCDDVLLWNEHGEITESTIANVALKIDGEWLTPSGSSGLLEGVFRASLLAAGVIREAVLHKTDVEQAEEIALINSVRKWMDVEWIPFTDSAPRPTATASEGASAP
jgi:para-aminobenzoate synthetase/4-amino-4-deoxychorismate lyase